MIFQRHTFAKEAMAGDFTAVSDASALLYFHEGADLDVITEFAPVEIGEGKYPHPLAELHIRGDVLKELVVVVHFSGRQDGTRCRWCDAFFISVAMALAIVSLAIPITGGLALVSHRRCSQRHGCTVLPKRCASRFQDANHLKPFLPTCHRSGLGTDGFEEMLALEL